MRKFFKAAYGTFSFCVLLLCVIFCFYYTKLPDKFYLSGAAPLNINTFFKITADYDAANPAKSEPEEARPALSSTDIASVNSDYVLKNAELRLFGIIPIKEVQLERIDRPVLVPCGTPFGIKIKTDGAVVTGMGDIEGNPSPARMAGIKEGDVIKSVNGMSIEKSGDITEAVQLGGGKTIVNLLRDADEITVELNPVKSQKDNIYKLGVWVRASSAGIGTLTFYESSEGRFGGLGHGVCDIDTGKILPLSKGEAVSVTISGIVKGRPGEPGELSGSFLSRVPIGTIERNTELGVFGTMNYAPSLESGIPMAFKQEVKAGPAKILTTTSGSSPKEYDIFIEKLDFNENNQVKNMIIRVTDKELLGKTGGIVQGMSGSPIIQNDMLVGAVTHVFISDTTRGYAIFAENMYRKMGQVMEQGQGAITVTEEYLSAA
ncbi:MAG: SpoIVB peptidase [Oscillospiraceae bacterium]|nr:SpoIVB peptidase [Oscillospiraceae bacterium]